MSKKFFVVAALAFTALASHAGTTSVQLPLAMVRADTTDAPYDGSNHVIGNSLIVDHKTTDSTGFYHGASVLTLHTFEGKRMNAGGLNLGYNVIPEVAVGTRVLAVTGRERNFLLTPYVEARKAGYVASVTFVPGERTGADAVALSAGFSF